MAGDADRDERVTCCTDWLIQLHKCDAIFLWSALVRASTVWGAAIGAMNCHIIRELILHFSV